MAMVMNKYGSIDNLYLHKKQYALTNEQNLEGIFYSQSDVSLYNQIDEDLINIHLKLIQRMNYHKILNRMYREYFMLIYLNYP